MAEMEVTAGGGCDGECLLKCLERVLRLDLGVEPHVREGRHTAGGRPSVDVSELLAAGLRGVPEQDTDSQGAIIESAFETPTNAFQELR
jgi:hypothetical protein